MSHLTPERRFDKNGKVVTRHVRAEVGKSPGPVIPPPSPLPGKSQRVELINHVREAMIRGRHGFMGLRSVSEIYASLDSFSDATVASYLKEINDNPSSGFDELLIGVLNSDTPGHDANYLLEIAKLDSLGSAFTDGIGRRYCELARQIRFGLDCYPEINYCPPEDITDQDDPEVAQAMGLIRLTMSLFNNDVDGIAITGDITYYGVATKIGSIGLVKLVLERPHDAERISAAVVGRGTDDAEVIREMLDSEAASLQDGAL